MKIKMLSSMAGSDYVLSVNEETDRFSAAEAKDLIKAGLAEKVAPPPVKKPETKNEWDDERAELLEENARLQAENEGCKAREAGLLEQLEDLSAFKASVVLALGANPAVHEAAVEPAAPEVRG